MGRAVGRVAEAMGWPLMPWQQYVADVAGEVDEHGRFVYPLCIVSVPRQSGKTTLAFAQSFQRALQAPNRRVWHTAQTGMDARKKWREAVDLLMTSPLRSTVKGRPRMGNGGEELVFLNGSKFRPHPPTRDSLHGEQSDTNNIDEPWAYDEVTGADLFQAITPTQLTRPGAQTFLWSTRGDASSTWFHGLIDRAYAGERGIAIFDWGIPFGSDPMDLDLIAANHPALGFTATLDSLRSAQVQLGDKPGEYGRAYGNVPTGAGERVIPREAVERVLTTDPVPAGRPAYGVGVSADGTWGSLWAAVLGSDGVPRVELVERRPGRHWLTARVLDLKEQGAGVAIDRRGPAGPVYDALDIATTYADGTRSGAIDLIDPGADYPAACQDFYDRVTDPLGPRVRVRDRDGSFDAACDVAGRRMKQDGAWVWSRTRSTGHIDALEGANLAAWAVARTPAPVTIGRVHFA